MNSELRSKVKIHGIKREIKIECEVVKHNREMIIFREYLPNGKLGKMYHSTSKKNLIYDGRCGAKDKWD